MGFLMSTEQNKTYTETDPANAEEKIINRFYMNILNKRKIIEDEDSFKATVTVADINIAWQQFKKEWFENKNA